MASYLKQFSPQIFALIFLGYAPFLGESFRFYVLPCSGFILLAAIFSLFHLKQIKHFLLQKNTILHAWIAITAYCILSSLWHWGQYPAYSLYLDLGPYFVMIFGMFFAFYLSPKITLEQLLAIFVIIVAALFFKTLYALAFQVPIPAEGPGFFIGWGGYIGFPRIIIRGENPFLISVFVLIIGFLALKKQSLSRALGLILALIITIALIALSGWRSIYFALIPCIILLILACLVKKQSPHKIILLCILSCIFVGSITLLVGRDATHPSDMVALSKARGMDELVDSKVPVLNADILSKMSSNQIPVLNSESVALKIGEYLQIIQLVGDHYWMGLGFGVNYYSPGPASVGNYVHSQPFWLYLKGGLILLTLFYGFIVLVLVKKYQAWTLSPQKQSIFISSLIVIGLCSMDVLTNQFPTLAGSFYLGFWIAFTQIDGSTAKSCQS